MRNIRDAATYLNDVRRLVLGDECKKGHLHYEAYRLQYGHCKPFLKFFPSTLPTKERKQLKVKLMELCTLIFQLDAIGQRKSQGYIAHTADTISALWEASSQWTDFDTFRNEVSYEEEASRIAKAVAADLVFLHDHVFVDKLVLLRQSTIAAVPDQNKYLQPFAQSGVPVLLFVSDSECWSATTTLDTPEKRMLLMELHHASQAKVYLDIAIKERLERRLAMAMALHWRLGGASGLGALSSCLMSKMLLDFGL